MIYRRPWNYCETWKIYLRSNITTSVCCYFQSGYFKFICQLYHKKICCENENCRIIKLIVKSYTPTTTISCTAQPLEPVASCGASKKYQSLSKQSSFLPPHLSTPAPPLQVIQSLPTSPIPSLQTSLLPGVTTTNSMCQFKNQPHQLGID